MEDHLCTALISSWSIHKHGHHRLLFFLICWFLKHILLWNQLAKSTDTWSSVKIAYFVPIVNKHGRHRQFLFLIYWILKTILLWNHFAKWTETSLGASMSGPLWRLLISSRSINKYSRHRQLFFSNWSIPNNLLWNRFA
jgi:hypothetical protein